MGSKMTQYLHARSLLKNKKVQLIHGRIDAIRPLFLFLINDGNVRVSYNHKGWLSDWTESYEDYEYRCRKATKYGRTIPNRSSSVFLVGKEDDAYILACKLLLKQLRIPLDERGHLQIEDIHDERDIPKRA